MRTLLIALRSVFNQADANNALKFSASGYYDWLRRLPGARRWNLVLTEAIRKAHKDSDETHAEAPGQLWVADMTLYPNLDGFLYFALVVDAFSRKVVGWSMGEQMTADERRVRSSITSGTRPPSPCPRGRPCPAIPSASCRRPSSCRPSAGREAARCSCRGP
ncbi:MAG: hypothetical protein EOO27_40020 [Comamonadaceae bacterium]|nr:MAG: hypothetical protein EOO27_40020 [Comamonadaceae bacterium]